MTELKVIDLPENKGLGNALKVSLENCKNEIVSRMDSDDVCVSNRFETQIAEFKKTDVDVVGGQIAEFIGDQTNITGIRTVKYTDSEIKRDMRKRCPMNHVSVMYRKSAVMKAGGYLDWYCNEDYYLWIRMMMSGAKFANVPDTLVNVRCGRDMSSRRGGIIYFKSEKALQKYMLKNSIISFPQYLYNVFIRFMGEVVAGNSLRSWLFKFTRKKSVNSDFKSEITEFDRKEKSNDMSEKGYPPFSVAMSVYAKDNSEWFDEALSSVVNQTVKPNEIVLVVDGPIPKEIQDIIEKWKKILNDGNCDGGGYY